MTTPISPKLLKGALIGIDIKNPVASAIIFQYNPEKMTRSVQPQSMGGEGGDANEVHRLAGPPKETIALSVEIDAADQLEQGFPDTVAMGIYPALSALEMMVYPKSAHVIKNMVLEKLGNIEIVPPEAPLTLFIWGVQRVVPVKVESLSIKEEAYDPLLNPILAEVDLSLQVLNYDDFNITQAGNGIFMAHQILKETMASHQQMGNTINAATGFQLI